MSKEQIITDFKQGMHTRQLSEKYGVSLRQIQRTVHPYRQAVNPNTLPYSDDARLNNLRPIIIALMESQGRDFKICELCLEPISGNSFDIHHTKYNGATYYDLLIVCRKCNTATHNRYLA